MKTIRASVTQRGQVTIPVEVQRLLGIQPRSRVEFVIEDGEVRLQPARHTLESVAGSVKATGREEDDFKRIIQDAKDERAERYAAKFGR